MSGKPPKPTRKVVPRVRNLGAGQGTCLECGSPAGQHIGAELYFCPACLSRWSEEAGIRYLRGVGRSADVKRFRRIYKEHREAGEA